MSKYKLIILLFFLFFSIKAVASEGEYDNEIINRHLPDALLRIDSFPKKFDFGTIASYGEKAVISLSSQENNYYVKISNLKKENTGYQLTVQAKPLTASDGSRLGGSNIELTRGISVLVNDQANESSPPKIESTIIADISDESNQTVPSLVAFAEAGTNQGLGTWSIVWSGREILLKTNANETEAKKYQTILIWTLSDVPQKTDMSFSGGL
ncbi:WxL domain-containing protein [Carnobacterium maltaromaticum]|uniref:WxL domain-containing protein n=1 Tax=Carnobacterium maltaromaticum TaxID=2751 RepID=UPI00295E38AD|nr:WxL domain-containing protein [Carnobacterium maltaromaticum]